MGLPEKIGLNDFAGGEGTKAATAWKSRLRVVRFGSFTKSIFRRDKMISATVKLTQALRTNRQFVAETGSGHHILLDDAAGATGAKPIELVAVALAGCTAFDVVTILRQKHHQKITSYEVRVEAEQADHPPQVFTKVRMHHVLVGFAIDPSIVEQAIHLSEDKYCSVGAMVKQTASLETTYEVIEEETEWIRREARIEEVHL
jgi:putative redox protein